jgi:hypothetical protein
MEKNISFGGVGSSIAVVLFFIVLFSISLGISMDFTLNDKELGFWSVLGIIGLFLFGIIIYFYPTVVAHDVSDRIEEIEKLREEHGLFKDVSIGHPYFWIIFIINIFFAATLIGWFVIFFWAHAPGTVLIPEVIANKISNKNDSKHFDKLEESNSKNTVLPLSKETNLESKLQEVENLVRKGLLTKEEASTRRNKLITED